jgi:signal transduction histidine kinase/CheY-like chemotaxis protein
MNRLSNRITLILLVVLGAVLGATGWLSVQNEREQLGQLLKKRGTSTAKVIAAHSLEMLVSQDYPALEFMLATVRRETPYIELIEVFHEDRIVARVGDPKAAGTVLSADVILQTHEGALPQRLGVVRLAYSEHDNEVIVAAHIREMMLASLLTFLVLAVALRLALSRIVLKRVENLTLRTEQVIARELPELTGGDQRDQEGDEIEALNRRFTAMLEGLQAREKARLKAESANEAKSQFLAHMSHEMRTPLNGIIGFQKLLSRTRLDEVQREYLRSSEISAKALLSVIDDILDFSKIEAGKLVIETSEFNLRTLMEDAVAIHYGNAVAKGVDIQLVCRSNVPARVRGASDRILQIVSNLVSNAVKFTEQGEILVTVDVRVAGHEPGSIEIAVVDSGIGMNEDQVRRIFQPFVQGDASTTRRFGGTGLGLAISSKLAALMGGELTVDSRVGKGSLFRLRLPLSTVLVPDIRLTRMSVCILCNQPSLTQALSEMLGALGIVPRSTAVTIEAEEWLSQLAPDANPQFIADFRMAGDNSAALRQRLEKIRPARWHWICPPDMPSNWIHALGPEEDWQSLPVRMERLVSWLRGEKAGHPACPALTCMDFSGSCLVVDDNDINRCLVTTLLQEIGLETVEADNGEKAVALFESRRFDMVFMDVHMPVMDGLEATRKIRVLEAGSRHTPIIALTANAFPGDNAHYLESGMDEVITKPMREELVVQVLQRWGLRREQARLGSRQV